MQTWTAEQLQAISFVAMSDESGWRPPPAMLPVAEELRARKVLERRIEGGKALYSTTAEFRAKAALAIHRGAASSSAPWN